MKYKYSELLIAREGLYRSKSGFEDKILAAIQGTRELIGTESFRSATKDAINAELSNYNLPLLFSYHDLANGLYNEWDRLMLRFQELVDEHSPAAVIDTSEFSGLKIAVKQPTQDILNLIAHPDLTIAYSAIGGMVGISNPSTADIKSHKEEALQSLRTTESRMESFNGELLGSGVTTTLSTIASGLSRSRKAVGMTDPYHNVEALAIFQDTKLRDQQIENSKALHEELIRYIRHYNPETAFDLSQMSGQELQTLGRTISLASHGNDGKKPQELIDFLKGNEVTFEKEITVFDNGQHYLKSKIQIKGHFKGESAITFNTKYKDGKLSQEGEYSVGGLSTDFLEEKANYKTKIGLKDYSITGEFSVADQISSKYGRLAPNLSIGFGYKNRSLEVGTKSEDGYRITYVKEHNQVKQDYGTVKTTNETGVRKVDHFQRTFDYVAEHPVESVTIAFGAVVAVGAAVAFAPSIIAALSAFGTLKLLGGLTSILIGISIFNNKGE